PAGTRQLPRRIPRAKSTPHVAGGNAVSSTGSLSMTTTKDGAFMEPRGCNRWQSVAGTTLGDNGRAPQVPQGGSGTRRKRAAKAQKSRAKQGVTRASFAPPPNASASMVRNAMKKGLPRSDAPCVLDRRREARCNVVRRFGSESQASRLSAIAEPLTSSRESGDLGRYVRDQLASAQAVSFANYIAFVIWPRISPF